MRFMDDEDLCTKTHIFNQPFNDRCQFVKDNCGDKFDFNNYFYFHFCLVNQNFIATIPLCVNFLKLFRLWHS